MYATYYPTEDYLNLRLTYCVFRYVFFYEKNNPVIKVAYLSGLVALINEQLAGEGGKEGQSGVVETHYRNTLGEIIQL